MPGVAVGLADRVVAGAAWNTLHLRKEVKELEDGMLTVQSDELMAIFADLCCQKLRVFFFAASCGSELDECAKSGGA